MLAKRRPVEELFLVRLVAQHVQHFRLVVQALRARAVHDAIVEVRAGRSHECRRASRVTPQRVCDQHVSYQLMWNQASRCNLHEAEAPHPVEQGWRIGGAKYGRPDVDYPAIERAFQAIGAFARETGLPVHFPLIGCGLAGGKWERVAPLIEAGLGASVPATLWLYKP